MFRRPLRARTLALTACAALAATIGLASPAQAEGVTGPAFYVDNTVYRTVGTPTDLSHTGAPAHAWDTIYAFDGAQLDVAESAPGDTDYNGGRWQARALSFPDGYAAALADGDLNGNWVIDSVTEVDAAVAAGSAVDEGVVMQFVCPVIKLPGD